MQTTATPSPEVSQLQLFVDGLLPHAAYALDRGWNVIASNDAARRLLLLQSTPTNIVESLVLDPAWRSLFVDWDSVAQSAVAQFRAAIGARPAYTSFVQSLAARSPDFADMWELGAIAGAPIWTKSLNHPTLGRLNLRYASLVLPDAADVSVSIYIPAVAEAAMPHPPTFV